MYIGIYYSCSAFTVVFLRLDKIGFPVSDVSEPAVARRPGRGPVLLYIVAEVIKICRTGEKLYISVEDTTLFIIVPNRFVPNIYIL